MIQKLKLILLRLNSKFIELCLSAINDDLDTYSIKWTDKHSCGVVIASEGYPESYESNREVSFESFEEENTKLFHAGTEYKNDKVLTSGGRVFCATALGNNLKEAQENAYNLVSKVVLKVLSSEKILEIRELNEFFQQHS